MSEPSVNEMWEVEVGGQIFEAPFGELRVWIDEGSLQPGDKVRKGKLRWIEARRVPSLTPFFNAKEQGKPLPVFVTTTHADTPAETPHLPAGNFVPLEEVESQPPVYAPSSAHFSNPEICDVHADTPSFFFCDGCGGAFCKACPHSYGGTVKICPSCGAMCRPLEQVKTSKQREARRTAAIDQGFGASDFFNALAHPFKHKPSLIFGALMFLAFSLGRSASAIGGIFMIVAAIFCVMLANMLTFGVLANTINNFSKGDLESNFMPDFEDFSLWDDVIHPFFLSIGAYLSSFGPFIAVLAVGFYLVLSTVSTQMQAFQQDVEKIPGTHYYDAQRTIGQSEEVKKVLGDIQKQNANRMEAQTQIASGNSNAVIDQGSKEQEELWATAQQSRKAGLESVVGKTPETREREYNDTIQGFLGLAAPLVILGFITFLWGAFYFPAACAVAGYTRSFTAAINPLIGLDTIRRLGLNYVKILLMGILLVVASAIVGAFFGMIFFAFDLPGMGNLPAKAFTALFTFYIWVVFSCILGYALFKSSDRLQLLR